MAELDVKTVYLEHEGGTKFYECVLLQSADNRPAMLIKRWGPMGKKKGGGPTKIERGSGFQMRASFNKILAEKRAKSYLEASTLSGYGLHCSNGIKVSTAALQSEAKKHYGDPVDANAIADHFGGFGGLVDEHGAAQRHAVHEPEPDRGDAWGAF